MDATVPGEPVGKGRPRVVNAGGFARAYTPKKTLDWENLAAWYFQAQWKGKPPHEGPVELHLHAVKSRPKRLLRKKDPDGLIVRAAKPDLDNVVKIAGDALERAGILKNDIQICVIHAYSWYAERDGAARVTVKLSEVS
jgi:Holliday junction resolvase RusA-like endonuclease